MAEQFLSLWRSGACDDDAHTMLAGLLCSCELAGRVIHGQPEEPGFGKLLSSDEWKRLSWVFGSDALHGFLGRSPRGICLRLGFGERWLDEKLASGKLFKLCIFPSASVSATKATWTGVATLLETHYPEVWPKISVHLPTIIRMSEEGHDSPISPIQKEACYDMHAANLAGRKADGESASEHYMSLQRLMRIEKPSLVQVRQFLWDEIGLKGLYRGDGYTYDDKGVRGNLEYLARQAPLSSIPGAVVLDVVPCRSGGDGS